MIEGVREADRGSAEATKKLVWHSRTLWNSDEIFGFSCEQLETSHDDFIELLHRFTTAKGVADEELPKVMWCSDKQDDRKTRLPHLFRADGFLLASHEMKQLLEGFDLGASRFVPVQLLHADKKTPWPGTHYFLYMPDRIAVFDPEQSRNYRPNEYDDEQYLGSMPHRVAEDDIAVRADALTGQDMWQDSSLLWSLFFTDAALEAICNAGLLGPMQIARCRVV